MCNCLEDKIKEMKEVTGYEEITPPLEIFSGRLYLSFSGKKPGVKKNRNSSTTRKMPILWGSVLKSGGEYGQ